MAVCLLRRAGIILIFFFRISYCEYDLLENLHPKRNDPPELTNFLQSVLHKKDEFKKIRETAKHLRLHTFDEEVFLNKQDVSRGHAKPHLLNLKNINREFEHTPYRSSNKHPNTHHSLNRRSGNSDRPINDVYPYMYDSNKNEEEPDEREERSSWRDVRRRKHKYHNQRNSKRYRRGLDLTDYNADKEFDRVNIKVYPRSKSGFRIVPGNRYQQKRDTPTKFNNNSAKRRYLKGTTSKEENISQIPGKSPFTERPVPDDFPEDHDILGFKAESLSESDIYQKDKELHNENTPPEDSIISKIAANALQENKVNLATNKLLLNTNLISHKTLANVGRPKRSTRVNVVDNIGKSVQAKEHLRRNTITTASSVINLEGVHKTLHSDRPYIKIYENPCHAINIVKTQKLLPDVLFQLDKQNEEQDSKPNQNVTKQNHVNEVSLIYQVDQSANNESEDHDDHSPQQTKNTLQDVDEPTSALEQYDLSTKPYIVGVPRSNGTISSFYVLKEDTEFHDSVDDTKNQFIAKDTRDMVHGKNKRSLHFIEKKATGVPDNVKKHDNEKVSMSLKPKRSSDYIDAISLRNKLDGFIQFFNYHDLNPENQLVKELSKIKRQTINTGKHKLSDLENTQNSDYYYQDQREMEPRSSFQGRKLQSFDESEVSPKIDSNDVITQNTRYGYLDYENGRRNRMKKPGFTENKIRVKRDLTDIFGMSNDEDYSEDLLDDYNPSVKQERSDYTYEEEGDLAVPEKQTYAHKKKNKNQFQNKCQNDKNGDNDYTTAQTYNSITTCGSSNQTSVSEAKVVKPKFNLKNRMFDKNNVNKDDNIKLNRGSNQSTVNTIKKVQCGSFKDSNKPNTKNEKCNNCYTNTDYENDENCKHCNRKIRSANEGEHKQFTSNSIPYSDKPEKVEDSKVENLENSDTTSINSRNIKQINSSKLGENVHGSDNINTIHSKTACSNTSSEGNNKPAQEEASSDQVEYKFGSHNNITNLCNDEQANGSKSHATKTKPSLKENVEPLQERGNEKNIVYSESEPEEYIQYETDYGKTVGFAHHPLKNKKTQNEKNVHDKYTLESKANIDDALTHFHTKHNQNEFIRNHQKQDHEELPDLETIANRQDEETFKEPFPDQSNDANYQNLPAHFTELENNKVDTNIKEKAKTQKSPSRTNVHENDAELSLPSKSMRNNKINDNLSDRKILEKDKLKKTNSGSSPLQINNFYGDVTAETKNISAETDKKQSYAKSREKKHAKGFLLNSVDKFADIVEEVNNKKVNKRQAHVSRLRNKSDMLNNIKKRNDENLNNVQPLNEHHLYYAPFEKFSQLNQAYWNKQSERKIRRPSYSQFLYDNNPPNKNKPSSMVTNFKQDLNYADIHNNMLSRKGLHNVNTNNLRRIRRDKLSKIPNTKTGSKNLERHETKTAINNMNGRKSRNKEECDDKCDKLGKPDRPKPGMKECINPNSLKSKQKQCLLAQDSGLNPNFGLKSSIGSCNDEAELEKGSKDYSQLHDALNGHLASLVVQTTFDRIKEHQQLKNRFSNGLAKKHGLKGEMKDLNAFRNNETEEDVKHTEEMLHQIMTVLNKIILDQVRRRTCKHLPPDLQKYLALLTKSSKKLVDEDAKISEEGFPLPLVKSGTQNEKTSDAQQGDFLFNNPGDKPEPDKLEADEEEIRRKMKMIKELLNKYEHMSKHCRTKVEDVEAYLKKHLCLLKEILKKMKQQQGCQVSKPESVTFSTKLKRKNYNVPSGFDIKQPDLQQYNQYSKIDLINKQLDSIGLGASRSYKPAFNLDKLIQDTKNKMTHTNLRDTKSGSSENNVVNSKSNYRNEDDTFEHIEDYETPKNEHKREIAEIESGNRPLVSEKYKKLVQAAESFRRKRASEEILGKLFGKPEKRSVRNENYETIKSMNKKYQDYSHIGFEKPVVFSLKK